MDTLNPEQISQSLTRLNVAWSAIPGEGLVRVWPSASFVAGVTLAQRLAPLIPATTRPTLLVTDDSLQLVLTAPVGGVTNAEVELAETIDALLQ